MMATGSWVLARGSVRILRLAHTLRASQAICGGERARVSDAGGEEVGRICSVARRVRL